MITSYIIVLALSAWLFATLLIYVGKRFGKLFGNPLLVSPGFVLLIPLLGFLVVVAAPASMLVGCLLLAGSHLSRRDGYLPPIARYGVPIVAALLASTHTALPTIANIPALALYPAVLLVLFGTSFLAEYLPRRLAPASLAILASSAPLLAAPFFGAPSYIAVDIAILASVILGANMSAIGTASVAIARQPIGLLIGWLVVTAACEGAWIPAILSLLIYLAGIGMAKTRSGTELEAYVA